MMKKISIVMAVWTVAAWSISVHGQIAASENKGARFAKPVRLEAGGKPLGAGRLYPSPAVFDVNGDQVPDVLVGDLFGRVTVALGSRNDAGITLGAEVPLKGRDGKQLKFENW